MPSIIKLNAEVKKLSDSPTQEEIFGDSTGPYRTIDKSVGGFLFTEMLLRDLIAYFTRLTDEISSDETFILKIPGQRAYLFGNFAKED